MTKITFNIEVGKLSKRDGVTGYPVYIRVYDRNTRKLTRYPVEGVFLLNKEDWDKTSKRVRPTAKHAQEYTRKIDNRLYTLQRQYNSLVAYIKEWEAFKETTCSPNYCYRIKNLINKLTRFETQESGKSIALDDINFKLIDDFHRFLTKMPSKTSGKNIHKNSITDVMKIFNSVLIEAKARGDIKENPFTLKESMKFKRETNESVISKEALTRMELERLERLELTGTQELVRDMFLFSFHTRGMRFEDVISISTDEIDYTTDKLTYTMIKNGKPVVIDNISRIKHIITKYMSDDRMYLFPLLKGNYGSQTGFRTLSLEDKIKFNKEKDLLNIKVNKTLKVIAELAEINKNISFHVARHTFATLFDEAYGTEATQHALCHTNARTTRKYLNKEKKADELKKNTTDFYNQFKVGTMKADSPVTNNTNHTDSVIIHSKDATNIEECTNNVPTDIECTYQSYALF